MHSSPQDSYLKDQYTDSVAAHSSEFRPVTDLESVFIWSKSLEFLSRWGRLQHNNDREASNAIFSILCPRDYAFILLYYLTYNNEYVLCLYLIADSRETTANEERKKSVITMQQWSPARREQGCYI